MKSDDPRLKKAHDDAVAAVNKLNDLIVTVLKYHVHTESVMVELIEAHGETAKETFAEKIKQCEDLNPPEIDAATWTLLRKANRLRNAVAHKIDGPEVKERIQQTPRCLRRAFQAGCRGREGVYRSAAGADGLHPLQLIHHCRH